MTREEKKALVDAVPFWWHTIDFGDGIVSPGQTPEFAQRIRLASIPERIGNKTVLDVGCWDGFFSFECEKRGATVTAVDNLQQEEFVKSKYGISFSGAQGFETARKILKSNVKYLRMNLFDIKEERFDIVIFFGVLYHTKYPLLALEHLYSIVEELLVLESHYVIDKGEGAYMKLYAGDQQNLDPTCWWGPTTECIQKMCEIAGFKKVEKVREYYDNDDRVIFRCYR
jgi:tRNA (mo5U34)-methyltransferase